MKAWLLVLTAALFVAASSLVSWSVESPGIRNPAGSGTIPQSSYRSGLVSSPQPIDTTGNLLMTGNVRRGMHFRGTVPYRSTTSFGATLGSSALSSFLRDTAGSEDFGGRSNKYRVQPFYSPTQTVTTMVPGRPGVFNPMNIRIGSGMQQGASLVGNGVLGLNSLPQEQIPLGQGVAGSDSGLQKLQGRYRPFVEPPSTPERTLPRDGSRSLWEAERLVPGQLGIRQETEMSAAERPQGRVQEATGTMEGLTTDSGQGLEPGYLDPQRRQNLPARDGFAQYRDQEASSETLRSRLDAQRPVGSAADAERSSTARSGPGTLEQFAPPKARTLQKGTSPLGTSSKFRTDGEQQRSAEHGDLTKRGVEGLKRDTGYGSVAPSGVSSPDTFGQEQREVLERIRQQLDALTKSVEAGLQEDAGKIGGAESVGQGLTGLSDSSSLYQPQRVGPLLSTESGLAPAAGRLSPAGDEGNTHLKFPERTGQVSIQSTVSPLDELRQRGRADLSANATRIKGSHGGPESFSEAKFSEHMSAAEDHLKAGRYYRAADSFTLAAVYQPSNPVVLAGRGHALFAAGEYMSSALFLARALAIHPDYAQAKVDLVAMLGGAGKLAERTVDVEQWLARSGSGQLQFLLSYVYFHTGRLSQAKQAIAAAHEKMPNSPAAGAMRAAIIQAAK